MPLPRLTAEEKILLHLADWMWSFEDYERPAEVTQHGIAEVTSIKRGYVAIVLGKMSEKGNVEVSLSRIRGKARSQKTYFLTPPGLAEATRLLDSLQACTVLIDSVEIPFSHAVRSGLAPMHVVKVAEMAIDRAPPPRWADMAPEAPAEPPVDGPSGPMAERTEAAEPAQASPIVEPPPAPGMQEGPTTASPAMGPIATGATPEMPAHPGRERPPPRAHREPPIARVEPPGMEPSMVEASRSLLTVVASTGFVLLLVALSTEPGSGDRAWTYVPGLMLLAVSLDLAHRSAYQAGPTLLTAFVLVHLSYMVRGTSAADALAIPLVAVSLIVLHVLSPRRLRMRLVAMAGTLLALHGAASAIPGSSVASGQPEAWMVLGSTVILLECGWRLPAEALRGVCLGTGLFALALAPFYSLDRFDDPLWALTGGYAAAAGAAMILLSTTGRPLRRVMTTAAMVAIGTAMLALAWTLADLGLSTTALVEVAIGVTVLVRAASSAGLRRPSDATLSVALGVAPTFVLAYGLMQALS
ncbi:MAG: hypothetical protein L0Z54_03610 [Thermoplasmata archaeon]|nr:hypothetical protein [Thermoplasmata archaeon]